MPAHQLKGAANVRMKSNGEPLTQIDIDANAAADILAKRGVEDHRVPFRVRGEWKSCHETTKQRSMWIARATTEANNLPNYPFSDSESSRRAAEEAKRLRAKEKAQKATNHPQAALKKMVVVRPPALGGHTMGSPTNSGDGEWRCSVCIGTSRSWKRFAPAKCPGSAVVKWDEKAIEVAERGEAMGTGHRRMISGDVIWCRTCGCYGDAWAKGLAEPCRGKPGDTNRGGRTGQLRCLRTWEAPPVEACAPARD